MAIYHLNVKVISKAKGQSACASASYISGEPIRSEALGQTFNNNKPEVVYSTVLLCENAPEKYKNREVLWNAVEKKEKSANARLARSLILALPNENTLEQDIELVNNFAQTNFVNEGMCVDIAIHYKKGNNHVHMLGTMREINEKGEWKAKYKTLYKLDSEGERIPVIDQKTNKQKIGKKDKRKFWEREDIEVNNWNEKETLVEWRRSWAEEQNKFLDKDSQVDHRTLAAQGIDREPTVHIGYHKGVKNKKMLAENAEIILANQTAKQNKRDIRLATNQVLQAHQETAHIELEMYKLKKRIEKAEKIKKDEVEEAKTYLNDAPEDLLNTSIKMPQIDAESVERQTEVPVEIAKEIAETAKICDVPEVQQQPATTKRFIGFDELMLNMQQAEKEKRSAQSAETDATDFKTPKQQNDNKQPTTNELPDQPIVISKPSIAIDDFTDQGFTNPIVPVAEEPAEELIDKFPSSLEKWIVAKGLKKGDGSFKKYYTAYKDEEKQFYDAETHLADTPEDLSNVIDKTPQIAPESVKRQEREQDQVALVDNQRRKQIEQKIDDAVAEMEERAERENDWQRY